MAEQKRIIYREGTGEITEKKSRFIAGVFSVKSEEEALAKVAELKKRYWDARHNCYAYIVVDEETRVETKRCSDDGEPAKTAGRPILDVMESENLVNALVVVTRYFGGVLLGTGGLVRAYQAATKEGLEHAVLADVNVGLPTNITIDYTNLGKVQYVIAEHGLVTMDTVYGSDVVIQTVVAPGEQNAIEKAILDRTAGQAEIAYDEARTYVMTDGKITFID